MKLTNDILSCLTIVPRCSHSFGEQFSVKKWTREMAGQREILAAYGGVNIDDIRNPALTHGYRSFVPTLAVQRCRGHADTGQLPPRQSTLWETIFVLCQEFRVVLGYKQDGKSGIRTNV